MTTILHLIHQLSLGGASRSLIAMAKHSARNGTFRHRVITLTEAEPAALVLAEEAGVKVVNAPDQTGLLHEMTQADIVQVHWWNNAPLQTILHWDLPPIRLLMWYHVAGNGVPQIITPELVRMADINVATNPFTHQELPVFRYMPASERAERLAMIYDAADFARFDGLEPHPHEHFNVGYIGTVDPCKMHPNYVPMSAGIRIPDARFVVCGKGIPETMHAQARRLGAAERFDFRGYVPDILPVLEVLDVFGYPLCENTCASSELSVQEAMLAGIPPVAFPHGGLKRLIVHEFTGLLVETERDYQRAIEHLFHHPEELGRLGRNAREYALQVFGAENAARKLNPLYERLLQRPKQARSWGRTHGQNEPQPSTSLTNPLPVTSVQTGSQIFIESLGSQAGDFQLSLAATDLQPALQSDQAVASASRLVLHQALASYRSSYPEDPWLAFWAGLGELHQGDARAAMNAFSHAINHSFPHPRVYWHVARAAEQAGTLQLARESLRQFLSQISEPPGPAAEAMQRRLHASQAGLDGLLTHPARPADPTNGSKQPDGTGSQIETLMHTAQEHLQAGNPEPALHTLRLALTLDSADPSLHLALGQLEFQLQQYDQAYKHLRLAAPHFPENADLRAALSDIHWRRGHMEAFENAIGETLHLAPDHPGALLLLARASFQSRHFQEAARFSRKILQRDDHHLDALILLAHCARETGEMQTLRTSCERILELAPGHNLATEWMTSASASTSSAAAPDAPKITAAPLFSPSSNPATPLVSVLVSTYNSEEWMGACLDDLEAQSIAAQLEIIVIDSGSEQKEGVIVAEFQKRFDNIRYLRTERESLYAAWNRALALARGEFIACANADDAHHPRALEKQVAALRTHPQADLAYSDVYETAVPNDSPEHPTVTRHVHYPPMHAAHALFYCPMGCHPLWRKSVFDRLGPFDSTYEGAGDYEFILRFLQNGLQAVHVTEPLSLFYKNPQGLGFHSAAQCQTEMERLQSKYRAEIPLSRIYRINADNPCDVSLAWTALGNLAMSHDVPWLDNPQQDHGFARHCYHQALHHDPANPTARYNLLVLRALTESLAEDDLDIERLPQDAALDLQQAWQRGHHHLRTVDLAPALEPLEWRDDTTTPVAEMARGTSLSSPSSWAPPIARETTLNAPPLRWIAPFLVRSDYGAEAIDFIRPLASVLPLGTRNLPHAYSEKFVNQMPSELAQLLRATRREYSFLSGGLAVVHGPADSWSRIPDADYHIGRTFAEADGLPASWISQCNQMDEVWVPSQFHAEMFAASGVERDKLHVVPGSISAQTFHPASVVPCELPHRAAFNFLSVFEWSGRSGWEVTLGAYFDTFTPEDDVCLYLHTWLPDRPDEHARAAIEDQIQNFLRRRHLQDKPLPRYELLTLPMTATERATLYRSADCLVAAGHGEGAARPQKEAMMMGIPVIGTNWGGFAEYLHDDHGWLVDYELIHVQTVDASLWHCRDQHWANPSESHLGQLMRQAQSQPELTRTKGAKARAYAQRHFSHEAVTQTLLARVHAIQEILTQPHLTPAVATPVAAEPEFPEDPNLSLQITWAGPFTGTDLCPHVNQSITALLPPQPDLDLTCAQDDHGAVSRPEPKESQPDTLPSQNHLSIHQQITVRHTPTPLWQEPVSGDWVLVQPWEFGLLPEEWIPGLQHPQEIWVPSRFARRSHIDSGIDPRQVKIVPYGIDPSRFHPDTTPLQLATNKRFKFLFVGSADPRHGCDLLLEAYLQSYTSQDDVCLVIKDEGQTGIPQGRTLESRIQSARARPNAPEILHLKEEVPAVDTPKLFTACDCFVFPYRSTAFGLAALQAMACGLPVVVTGGGATDDFASDEFTYRLPARLQSWGSEIDGLKLVHPLRCLEPDAERLAQTLQSISAHPEDARRKGLLASQHVCQLWTWERAAIIAAQRLHNLAQRRQKERLARETRRARRVENVELPAVARLGQLGEAWNNLHAGNLEEAWIATQQALQARPFHPEAYLLLSEIARAAGDESLAERCARQSRRLAPKWKPAQPHPNPQLKTAPSASASFFWKPPTDFDPASSSTPKLTVCLIAKNEERLIGQCLDSVRALAHQIVVVDTGSTDWTRSIAERYGAEVHPFEWNDDFSAARNFALQFATGDWILVLDADEVLSEPGQRQLKDEMDQEGVMAWRLPIADAGQDRETAHYVPRLFRNAPGLYYIGRVHEQIFSSIETLRAEWGLENRLGQTRLMHHGYSAEALRDRNKIARNLALLESAVKEMPNEPNLLLHYGLELVRSQRLEAGLEQYWEAFHLLSTQSPADRVPELVETLLSQLTTHLVQQQNHRAVIELLESPLARAQGLTASLDFALGLAHMELTHDAEAARHFRECLGKRHTPTLSPVNPRILKAGPRHCLAICLWKLKATEEAAQTFADALAEEPNSQSLRHDYGLFLANIGRIDESHRIFRQIVRDQPGDLNAWIRGGQIVLSRPDHADLAGEWTEDAMELFPHHETLLTQRAEALLYLQKTDEALALWGQLALPGNARHLAARILCEIAEDKKPELQSAFEPAVSDEFLKWHRQLVVAQAATLLAKLSQRLDQIHAVLPSAARSLRQAFTEEAI